MTRAHKKILFSREFGGENALAVAEEAIKCENQGFDILWVPDHLIDTHPLFSIFDAWTVLAYIGAKTNHAKLGSGVTDVQRIHPAKTANIIATLDHLTGGRAVLGIGSGEVMNTEAYGIKFENVEDRVQRTKEAIQVIKALWASRYDQPVDFSGHFYTLKRAYLNLTPYQIPAPPIYVGAFSSPRMLRVAGEVADGWYPASYFTLETYRKKVAVIKEAAKEAGRNFDDIDIIANVPTIVMDKNDKQKMGEITRALKKRMIVNRHYFRMLGIEELLPNFPRELEYQLVTPNPESASALNNAVERLSIPDEILKNSIGSMMALGSIDDCVSSIEHFIDEGATHVFFPNFIGSKENYELISREIIPRLRS